MRNIQKVWRVVAHTEGGAMTYLASSEEDAKKQVEIFGNYSDKVSYRAVLLDMNTGNII